MKSQPRKYTHQEVLDLIENDPGAENAWRDVTQDLPREKVDSLKKILLCIANAPWSLAELRKSPWQKEASRKRLSRLATTLDRLAPSVEEAIANPMLSEWFRVNKPPPSGWTLENIRAAKQLLAETPKGMRGLAKMIRASMEASRYNRRRLNDQVASAARDFLWVLEAADRLDFELAADILRPVYKAAGMKPSAPVASREDYFPADPSPTSESLKALRRRWDLVW